MADNVDVLSADFKRLESKVDKLTDAVMRLVLIEERQTTQGERIGACEAKIVATETTVHRVDRKVDQWINRGIGVWAVAVVLFAVMQLGAKIFGK
jgi:uncharacterized coiled-coil protein SlyX